MLVENEKFGITHRNSRTQFIQCVPVWRLTISYVLPSIPPVAVILIFSDRTEGQLCKTYQVSLYSVCRCGDILLTKLELFSFNFRKSSQAARKHIQSFLASGEIKIFYVWREMYQHKYKLCIIHHRWPLISCSKVWTTGTQLYEPFSISLWRKVLL